MKSTEADAEALLKRIGSSIAIARKRARQTQAVVANKIGVEKETVSRIENGAIAPTVHRLSQFAELFKCSIGSLFGEHQAAAGEDASAMSALIGDLPREDRQTILRLVSDVAAIAREKAAWQERAFGLERDSLVGAPASDKRRGRSKAP